MAVIDDVRSILGTTLQLGERTAGLEPGTQLFGHLPELDSMAVVTLLTAIEEHYDIYFDDDEISAETFETLGSLAALVDTKLNGAA